MNRILNEPGSYTRGSKKYKNGTMVAWFVPRDGEIIKKEFQLEYRAILKYLKLVLCDLPQYLG